MWRWIRQGLYFREMYKNILRPTKYFRNALSSVKETRGEGTEPPGMDGGEGWKRAGEGCGILDNKWMTRKWGDWSTPGKGAGNTNVLGEEGFDLSSGLTEGNSSRLSKGECGRRQCWGNRQKPGLICFLCVRGGIGIHFTFTSKLFTFYKGQPKG